MPDLSIFKSPAPYHTITYGTLLGTQIYQSFVGGIISFRALPRPQFSALQQKILPVYFALQTALPAALILTYPGPKSGLAPSGLSGALIESNRWTVLAPLASVIVTGLANMLVIGPATVKIMKERKHQETRDGKKSYDPAPHSQEMQKLNKAFGQLHGISTLVNLVSIIASMWYGVTIAGRLD
ncbi:hypothetical protein F5884DRAFT_817941 [Xylogone sp. PMI_703]|nr:hypothetical protein F5884DRAFT_817941 [Xylogone sp. PMI_703]